MEVSSAAAATEDPTVPVEEAVLPYRGEGRFTIYEIENFREKVA